MKYIGRTIAAAAGLLVAATAAQAHDVKIGFIAPKSGGAAQLGDQLEKGARLYMKLHGAALGHGINMIVRDSKRPGGPIAKAAAQELITREKVDIITGIIFSPNAMSIAPLINKAKVPLVIMNAGTAFIPNMSPYIVRVSFTMWHSGYIMGDYAAKKMGCKTAASGFTNYPPGKDSVNAFKTGFEAAGGKVVDQVPMGGPREVPDFTPFFQRVKDKKPGCFYVFVPAGNHAAAVVKTYSQLGMRNAGVRLIGPGDITQDTKLQGMGDAAVGMVTTHHYNADLDTPENKRFVKAWKAEYGANTTPDFLGVQGYDGMAAIFHVIKNSGDKITAEGATALLKGWTFASPRGPIAIDPETRDVVMNEYISIVRKKGGRLVQELQETVVGVKDQCKALKLGKCGKKLY
ncbi:MAG: ABC transporter substrate-binding protein [Alphaproteobacteria bacterium]